MDFDITKEEKQAIDALKKLAKKWPKTLWLFACGGNLLSVMRTDERGRMVTTEKTKGGFDPDYRVDIITGIHNDGGDW
jgi:hypothetical protein